MAAFNALMNGKDISVEIGHEKGFYYAQNAQRQGYTFSQNRIANGKWYIED